MYVSIRDFGAREVARALGNEADMIKALKYLGVEKIELEYFSDDSVYLLKPKGKQAKVNLTEKEGQGLLEEQLRRHNIGVSAFLMHNNFGDPDMKRQIEWIIRCVEAAECFKVGTIRIDPIIGTEKDISVEEAARMSVEALKKVFSQLPADRKVYLAIENHGKYGNNPKFLRNAISQVNDDRLGLTLDSGNFYWFGFPLDQVYNIFEEFARLARHTHIKNIKYPKDIRDIKREMGYRYGDYVCPIYEGDIDHRRFVDSLQKAGYTEDLCMEDESLGKHSPEDILDITKKDAEYLKGLIA